MSDEFGFHDAPYLLGSLEDDERRAFERHLATCPECSARVEELRPTVAAMRAARDAGAAPPAPPAPPTLLPDLLERAARERRRRRLVVAGSGLLAAAAVVALVVVLLVGGSRTPTPSASARALRPVGGSVPIHATAALVSTQWGTRIDVTCRYDPGFSPSIPYDLVVVDTNRTSHPAGSWRLVPGRETTFTGGTDVARSRIAAVRITLPNGQAILQLDVE